MTSSYTNHNHRLFKNTQHSILMLKTQCLCLSSTMSHTCSSQYLYSIVFQNISHLSSTISVLVFSVVYLDASQWWLMLTLTATDLSRTHSLVGSCLVLLSWGLISWQRWQSWRRKHAIWVFLAVRVRIRKTMIHSLKLVTIRQPHRAWIYTKVKIRPLSQVSLVLFHPRQATDCRTIRLPVWRSVTKAFC